MTYAEDDLLPISALQHLLYCPRQCALIHVERIWRENLFTAEGRILHERVHCPAVHRKRLARIEFSLPLSSLRLGLAGSADVVEFHLPPAGKSGEIPYPVEYKRGKPKPDQSDMVQLCAQALCLEEMLGVSVPEGALFYGREQRRVKVVFATDIRSGTETAARTLHELVGSGRTPSPEAGAKCRACSLLDACLPRPCSGKMKVSRYVASTLEEP
jgi:CRISPR-associated exonuclease Cas4